MAEIRLEAKSFLGGVQESIGNCQLREETGLALVSAAIPRGGDEAFAAILKSALKLEMPEYRVSTLVGDLRALHTTADQLLLITPQTDHEAETRLRKALADAAYTTVQTDVLVALTLSGAGARAALERICPVDLHDDAFPVDAYARTVMDHMGATVIRTGNDSWMLLSASSSAGSFLHAVTTSMAYVA